MDTPTSQLDLESLLALANIGKLALKHPVKVVVNSLGGDSGRKWARLALDLPREFVIDWR